MATTHLSMNKFDALDVLCVTQSYGRCCVHPDFFNTFYETFMAKSPAIPAFFSHTDMTAQKIVLRTGIAHLIGFAKGKGIAQRKIEELGESHNRENLKISPELYNLWIDALLESVRQYDPQFDLDSEAAWRKVLARGIELMKSRY